MFGSWKLGTIRGIGVHIHWTFWLIPLLYAMAALAADGLGAGIYTAVLILAIFACVVAHEFGHALAAAAYGIATHDITLLPIGGLARLERMPEKPSQELVIALAGPAVNVVIAAALFVGLPLLSMPTLAESPWALTASRMVEHVLVANVVLVLFNMLPAFPMDGGRVLRSLLAMRTSHLRATEIAARVGRWMALLFVIAAFPLGQLSLLLVGGFVFLAGTGELMNARRLAFVRSRGGYDWSKSFGFGGSAFGVHEPTPIGHGDEPTGNWPSQSRDGEIIDAIEVREIRSPVDRSSSDERR